MAKTTGERAMQEARAFKGRAWFRDLAQMVYGLGEYRATDGTLHKMRHEHREARTHHSEARALGWIQVDQIALMCYPRLRVFDGELQPMLETLRLQTPDIFSWYQDAPALGQTVGHYRSEEVAFDHLGQFKLNGVWEEAMEIDGLSHGLPDVWSDRQN